jgi:phospholipase C
MVQGGFTRDNAGACSIATRWRPSIAPSGSIPHRSLRFRDYVPHHNPFQYYASTANPLHLPPTSLAMVGKTDQAKHLYDLTWFWTAAQAGHLPAVSFLKAPAYQNGHPGTSNPLDEQVFLVETINRLQQLPEWRSMAVIIATDDSDGWYDHVMPPIVNQSNTPIDFRCGSRTDGPGARCGYGPRLPLLVISPYARANYVSHALTDQTSILRFIEDNWLGGQRVSAISFDRIAGPLADMFDFSRPVMRRLL